MNKDEAIIEDHVKRKRVLVCVPYYLPGYKSGGPIRAIANMVAHLSQYLDFYIITRDRDAGDPEGYPGITPDTWCRVGNAQVLYCSSIRPAILRRVFLEVRPDLINLNSFQDKFTRVMVMLRRRGAFGRTPVLIAPRGEFSQEALKIKKIKKVVYRRVARFLGLYKDVAWQLSTPREKPDLLLAAPARSLKPELIHIAYEITDIHASGGSHIAKERGSLSLIFLARISEMKNLHFLLDALQGVRGEVQLDIFGPVAGKDAAYWERCKRLLPKIPKGVNAEYKGPIEHSAVPPALCAHHFFVLPTKGENFCHAAVESFVNGTPVILSDATPWTGLREARAGFDIPLQDRKQWAATLQECIDMDQEAYTTYLRGAREYGRRFSIEQATQQQLAAFRTTLSSCIGIRACLQHE